MVPALLAAIAYVDPGNFGVNITAGTQHGYRLVFVVVGASLTAGLIQYLAAKLGVASGMSLPEACSARYSRPVRILLWVQAELVVIMTDLAEVVGGAIALYLLFGMPLPLGALVIAGISLGALALRVRGHEGVEGIVLVLFVVIVLALGYQVLGADVDHAALLRGLAPSSLDSSATLLAVGIIGATVMPHALHFHSAASRTTPERAMGERREIADRRLRQIGPSALARSQARAIAVAMTIAGFANTALVVIAAGLPTVDGRPVDGIEQAHALLQEVGAQAGALALALALLASGLASTLVGVRTGQVVMEGFAPGLLGVWGRRLLALVPPVGLLMMGLDGTTALVLSQVALSFALPGTLIPLVLMTRRPELMGALTNARVTTVLAAAATAVIVALDLYLIVTTLG